MLLIMIYIVYNYTFIGRAVAFYLNGQLAEFVVRQRLTCINKFFNTFSRVTAVVLKYWTHSSNSTCLAIGNTFFNVYGYLNFPFKKLYIEALYRPEYQGISFACNQIDHWIF